MKRLMLVASVVVCAACASPSSSQLARPTAVANPTALANPATSGPTTGSAGASASVEPSPPPSTTGCPVPPKDGALASNQLVSVKVTGGPAADRVTFTFGPPASQPTSPRGHLREIRPPIVEGASGNEIKVDGQRYLEVKFDGMYLFDASGKPAFTGSQELHPKLTAIREVLATEAFEGVFTWVVGFNGGGCATLGGDPAARTVTLDIAHPLG